MDFTSMKVISKKLGRLSLIVMSGAFALTSNAYGSDYKKTADRKISEKNNVAESKKILRYTNKDGSVTFSDVAIAGAKPAAEVRYRSTAGADALRTANAHKDYWRNQSEGFNQRQASRDRTLEADRLERLYLAQAAARRDAFYGHPRVVYGGAPSVGFPPGGFPQQGVTGVSSIHNVPSSFIGSGFATSSPLAPSFTGRR